MDDDRRRNLAARYSAQKDSALASFRRVIEYMDPKERDSLVMALHSLVLAKDVIESSSGGLLYLYPVLSDPEMAAHLAATSQKRIRRRVAKGGLPASSEEERRIDLLDQLSKDESSSLIEPDEFLAAIGCWQDGEEYLGDCERNKRWPYRGEHEGEEEAAE
jgi:hypothetical protein